MTGYSKWLEEWTGQLGWSRVHVLVQKQQTCRVKPDVVCAYNGERYKMVKL